MPYQYGAECGLNGFDDDEGGVVAEAAFALAVAFEGGDEGVGHFRGGLTRAVREESFEFGLAVGNSVAGRGEGVGHSIGVEEQGVAGFEIEGQFIVVADLEHSDGPSGQFEAANLAITQQQRKGNSGAGKGKTSIIKSDDGVSDAAEPFGQGAEGDALVELADDLGGGLPGLVHPAEDSADKQSVEGRSDAFALHVAEVEADGVFLQSEVVAEISAELLAVEVAHGEFESGKVEGGRRQEAALDEAGEAEMFGFVFGIGARVTASAARA